MKQWEMENKEVPSPGVVCSDLLPGFLVSSSSFFFDSRVHRKFFMTISGLVR